MKSAFPLAFQHTQPNQGMTMHEYYAAQALVGLLACSRIHDIDPNQMDRACMETALLAHRLAKSMIDAEACQP